jgi:hypothetical protein
LPLSSVIPAVKPLETIWDAAIMRDWDTVIQWLRRDPSQIAVTGYAWYPDDYDEAAYKSTLLHLAATYSDVGVLKYLVSLGADVNAVPDAIGSHPPWHTDSRPPLHFAARYNSVEVLEYLISEGADVHAKCYNGHTPLHDCIVERVMEYVREKEVEGSYAEFSTYERIERILEVIERLHRATGLTHQNTGTHFLTVNKHIKIDYYEKMRSLKFDSDF